jgi:hypothetical protein
MNTTTIHHNVGRPAKTTSLYRGTQIVWYLLDLVEVLLGFRFLLKLLGANPAAGFTDFIYDTTAPLVAPFVAVFRTARVAGSTFEWTTLLAMAVYWILAWGIIKLFLMGKPISPPQAENKLNRLDDDANT